MPTVGDIAFRGRGVGLFLESGDREDSVGDFPLAVDLDIAELGIRSCRLRTEQDDRPGFRLGSAFVDRVAERRIVAQHMVRRHQQQQFVSALRDRPLGGQRSSSGGVPTRRFDKNRARFGATLVQLLLDEKALIFASDHQQGIILRPRQADRRLLEHRMFGCDRKQLLGEGFAGNRPQARARSAA